MNWDTALGPVNGPIFKDVPYFCNSHLLMRFTVGPAGESFPVANFRFDPRTQHRKDFTAAKLATIQRQVASNGPDRRFDFGRSGGIWVINNQGWHSEPINPFHQEVSTGNVGQTTMESWELRSGGGWFHPIHIHLIDFAVLRRDDRSPAPWEFDPSLRATKDMVSLGNGNKVQVAASFGPHRGFYMFHCHNAVHEDNAMMRTFRVVKASLGLRADTASFRNSVLGPYFDANVPRNASLEQPTFVPGLPLSALPALTSTAYLQGYFDQRFHAIYYPRTTPEELALRDPAINPFKVADLFDCTVVS